MKKAISVISVIVIGSLLFIGKGYSQNLDDEKIYLKKRALSSEKANPASTLKTEDFLNITNEAFLKNEGSQRSKRTRWYSTDSGDLASLIGTAWVVAYKISSVYSDVLTFGTQVTKLSDGTVALKVSNQFGDEGAVFYCDLVQGGRGFAVVISGTSYTDLYEFTNNDNIPQGIYYYKDNSTGNYSDAYSLTGMKWGSDIGASGNCVSIGNNLNLNVSCLSLNGNKYGLVLNHITSSDDPFGYYWKLDVNSITQK